MKVNNRQKSTNIKDLRQPSLVQVVQHWLESEYKHLTYSGEVKNPVKFPSKKQPFRKAR